MLREKLDATTVHSLIARSVLDAPEWTEADHRHFEYRMRLRSEHPDWNWSALNGVPRDTRIAILKAGIDAGKVAILGGMGGFQWRDLLALGWARRSAKMTTDGSVDSIAFCYTGPRYLNVEGTFTSQEKWFDEGGACNEC